MPANWSSNSASDDLDDRAQLIEWLHLRCEDCEVDLKATGKNARCARCGSRNLTERS